MSQFEVLQKVGLTKTGVRCYASLQEQGPARARRLAGRLDLPATNLYGVLADLVEQGFVSRVKLTSRPALFIARPLNEAMREHFVYQSRLVRGLCNELGVPSPPVPRPVFKNGR